MRRAAIAYFARNTCPVFRSDHLIHEAPNERQKT
jgi:hypothetical protein